MVVKTMPKPVNIDTESSEDQTESKEVLVIAQEIKIVKALACNDLQKRNQQLKRLKKWLELRTRSSFPFKEEDFRRIWKGLYYTMWMSDKPLVQEELAEQLGKMLLCFGNDIESSTNFFGAFLYTMAHQWFGIDQWRIDKFMMLARRMLRYMLRVLKDADWSNDGIEKFNNHLTKTLFVNRIGASGLTMHFLDIFCEELAKVANGDITAEQVGKFVQPFVVFYCTQPDYKLTSHCRTRIFYHLLYQSALGREYMEKYEAWKEMGFPTESINDLEKAEDPNEHEEAMNVDSENENQLQPHLDPRAGNVDVIMPELPVDTKYLIEILEPFIKSDAFNMKRKKLFRKLLEIFKVYQLGEFPLGIKRMPISKLEPEEEVISSKIEQLDDVENELYGVGRKLKQLNKRKRRKLLKSINFDTVDEENLDEVLRQALPKDNLKERKRKVVDQMLNSWVEEDVDEDLVPKKKVKPSTELKETSKNDVQLLKKKAKKLKPQNKEKLENSSLTKNDSTPVSKKNEAQIPTQSISAETKPVLKQKAANEWEETLEEGEVEYFIPSRKLQLKRANSELVLNPLAIKKKLSAQAMATAAQNSPKTPNSKRVKIALKHNTAQNPSEYIRQVKCSPDVPYDANRRPGKGLLKPNCVPSPINPFYKKKIGLRLLNDTM